jgi:hypothetical protein
MQALARLFTSMIVCGGLALGASTSFGAYAVTNGGFDAQDASVNNNATVTPTGWFNASNDVNTFSDNILNALSGSTIGTNVPITNATGATAGGWDANGLALGRDAPFGNDGSLEQAYVYQPIGTYAGEATLGITGFVYNRVTGGSQNQVGNFDVGVYYTSPGGFTPSVGLDVGNSGTLVGDKQVFTQGVDFTIAAGATAGSAAWTHTVAFAGSGITNGSTVWLRIGDGGNPDGLTFDEPVIDNVNVAGCGLGDVNCDGHADLATDFTAIRNNYRKTVASRALGDLDGSGAVDFLDYLQWRRAFLAGGGSAASIPSLSGVPEPTSALLSVVAAAIGAGVLVRRKRRQQLHIVVAIGAVVALIVAGQRASAIDDPWNTVSGNWNTAANWGNIEVPNATNDQRAVIDNGGTAILNAAAPQIAGMDIGQTLGNTGTLEIDAGGSLNAANVAGKTGAGIVNVGVVNTGGVAQGTGTLNMTGGTLTAAQLVSAPSALNVVNLSGNTTVSSQTMSLSGTVHITGPNVNISSPNLVLQGQFVNVIAGITSTTQHSAIKSSATATVGGSLSLDFASGVTPNFGDHWNIVDAKTILGNFTNAGGVPTTVAGVAQAPILGEGYHVRLVAGGTNGKVLQVSRDKILALQVNRDTGAINIINPQTGAIQIESYLISSSIGALKPTNGNWNSLTDQGKPNWQEGSPTVNHIGELNSAVGGNLDLSSGSPQSLGNAYDDGAAFSLNGIGASSQDLTFSYSNLAGEVLQGQVTYIGTGKSNNLLLTINPTTGAATLKNDSPGNITIDGYSILSSATALVPGSFNDAATANLTSVAPTTSAISELATNPNAPLVIAGGSSFNLGNIFNTASAQSGISLEFTTAGQNRLYNGVVRFLAAGVAGDYNGNGVVDAGDYTVWRDHLGQTFALTNEDPGSTPGTVTIEDYNYWKAHFGASSSGSGAGSLAAGSVPEPSTVWTLVVGFVALAPLAGRRCRKTQR